MNSNPASKDVIRASIQDSQCQDDPSNRKEAYQDDRIVVMLYCRASEVASCCCYCCCLGYLDSE